eukprot:gnl/TRDRNA2_/TRDRNA2_173982_c0_seq4.p1 gnl/TRDRNA2_/TRDRNA2_173982_c0~~gnl/TRDRNA2_/TRDRNA2_173982_c0_seq4.p1  ORF type:complete len:320 (-),score=20.87 gnl/TRDRNA2_/TRDRNA2_173982_c0_seq4:76-1035(-)
MLATTVMCLTCLMAGTLRIPSSDATHGATLNSTTPPNTTLNEPPKDARLPFKRVSTLKECDDLMLGLEGRYDMSGEEVEQTANECNFLRYGNGVDRDTFFREPDKLTYVHVGKCTGTSVEKWLWRNKIPHGTFHIRTVNDCDVSRPHKWLIATRDPIKRAISAFNWRSPRNGKARHGGLGFSPFDAVLYRCFKTVNEFAEHLDDASECGRYARKALEHATFGEHLGLGFDWYFPNISLNCILKQDVQTTRTEFLETDLRRVAGWLNLTNPDMYIPHHFSTYPMSKFTQLSPDGRAKLSKALAKEYEVLHELLEASNVTS